MRTHNTGVVSSIPPCATIKTPSVRKAVGNHLIKSTLIVKLRALVTATLEIEYATQFSNHNKRVVGPNAILTLSVKKASRKFFIKKQRHINKLAPRHMASAILEIV